MSENFDKYLAIAGHDIQTANNMGELKSYVASILYDNDKKAELLQQKEGIIKEAREYVKQLIDLKEEDYLKSVSLIYIEKILEILDKENK